MISTHQLEAAEAMSDRVIVLNHGAVRCRSAPSPNCASKRTGSLEDIFLDITGS